MMSHEPIAYTYEASEHCPHCTLARFGCDTAFIEEATDREGNFVHAVMPWEAFEDRAMVCGTCGDIIHEVLNGAA